MATVVTIPPSSSSLSTNLIHNLLRFPKPPSSSVCLFLKPFSFFSVSISQSNLRNNPRFQPFVVKSLSSVDEPDLEEDEEEDELDSVRGIEEWEELGRVRSVGHSKTLNRLGESEEILEEKEKTKKSRGLGLKLSIEEKKELASYAHSLGDKLKCQLVGNSGVTNAVVFSFLETLEKNEILKVKIRNTSRNEMEDAVRHLVDATGSVAVGKTGRTVLLYRPSLTKLKAEEKKKEIERKSISRKQKFANSRPTRPFRREVSERPDGRGRRGGSRVATN